MAAAHEDYNPQNVTLDLAHPKLELLNAGTQEQLSAFIETRGKQSKEDLSDLIMKNIAFLESSTTTLNNIQNRAEDRQRRLQKVQEQQENMERNNEAMANEIETLKANIGKVEEQIKEEEEGLESSRSARLNVESKMDVAFLKRVNNYLEHNAEIPVVNMINIFVGLLRNDKDVNRVDTELIFKTFASFQNKLKSVQPALMNRDVLDHYQPQIELYKKFIKNKDDTQIVAFVDFDGEDHSNAGVEEAKRLIEKQRQVMGPWTYFLIWADHYVHQARKEVFRRMAKKSVAQKQRKIDDNTKAISHNQIILGNYKNDNIQQNLQDEQNRDLDCRDLIRTVHEAFEHESNNHKNHYRKFEDKFFETAHNKFSEEKRQHHSPQK